MRLIFPEAIKGLTMTERGLEVDLAEPETRMFATALAVYMEKWPLPPKDEPIRGPYKAIPDK